LTANKSGTECFKNEPFYRTMHVVLARYCYRKSSVRPSVCTWRWCTVGIQVGL